MSKAWSISQKCCYGMKRVCREWKVPRSSEYGRLQRVKSEKPIEKRGPKPLLSDEEILKLFYDVEEMSVKEAEKLDDLPNKVLIEDATDSEKGLVVARAFEPLSKAVVKQIAELGVTKIKVVDTTADEGIVIKCMKKDPAKNEEEALKDIYRRLRPGDLPTAANARAFAAVGGSPGRSRR